MDSATSAFHVTRSCFFGFFCSLWQLLYMYMLLCFQGMLKAYLPAAILQCAICRTSLVMCLALHH